MLTITKLRGAEYLISSVAKGMEDYYMGAGEAPGVWQGRWAESLGLEGVVGAAELRALVDGLDPRSGEYLLAGLRERKVRAVDVTLSVPKSVSLLWAFGTPETTATVSIAVVEATAEAVGFLEERAAFARQQTGGVRRRVTTGGFAVATFTHRTSRDGEPQLHTHCLIPNVVQRADGQHVAFDAAPLHDWGKAAGTVFLNSLERSLTQQLGVSWGPERNGSRELVGFTREQLRAFSKRTVAIETHLEARDEIAFSSKAERMRADDRASLATRARKDKTLTPARLRERWAAEAQAVGLEPGREVDALVVGRQLAAQPGRTPGRTPGREREWPRERERESGEAEIFAALADPHTGLCTNDSRFGEARAVRADDPLAFGVDRLRHARHTYRHDLQRLDSSLPPDRSDHLARAEADLRHHETNLGHHQRSAHRAQGDLDQARQRRWGRRDQPAIDRAEAALGVARANLQATADAVAQDKTRVHEERGAVRAYQAAIDDTASERSRLRSALADIDHGLAHSRSDRVLAAGADPASDLSRALGPRPTHPAGRDTWSAIADRIETWRDQRPPVDTLTASRTRATRFDHLLGPRPLHVTSEWDRLSQVVDRSQHLIVRAIESDHVPPARALDDPARWHAVLEHIERAARAEAPHRHVERGFGIEL